MPILSGKARLAGVIGWPVSHSRSPLLHNHWLARHRIDGAYVPLAVPPAALARVVPALAEAGFAGLNVTLPHKGAVRALCDVLDPAAERVGAVNTLIFADGRIRGLNTDVYGFLAHLRAERVEPGRGPALVLGAGGAARAIVTGLREEGAEVWLCARREDAAAALARDLGHLRLIPWEAREDALAEVALLVNTTSGGMTGNPPLALSLARAHPALVVADIVYAPLITPLLAEAQAHGLRTVDGLGMLLHQAVPGFEAWFGIRPDVDAEVRALLAADLGAAA